MARKTKRGKAKAGLHPSAVAKPRDPEAVKRAAMAWLTEPTLPEAAQKAAIGLTSMKRWIVSPWWRGVCEEVAAGDGFRDMVLAARRTVLAQANRTDRDEAFRILERIDRRLAPPKQQIELSVNYMHRDEVLSIVRGFVEDAAELLDDPERRAELIRRSQARLAMLSGAEEVKLLTPGSNGGG